MMHKPLERHRPCIQASFMDTEHGRSRVCGMGSVHITPVTPFPAGMPQHGNDFMVDEMHGEGCPSDTNPPHVPFPGRQGFPAEVPGRRLCLGMSWRNGHTGMPGDWYGTLIQDMIP